LDDAADAVTIIATCLAAQKVYHHVHCHALLLHAGLHELHAVSECQHAHLFPIVAAQTDKDDMLLSKVFADTSHSRSGSTDQRVSTHVVGRLTANTGPRTGRSLGLYVIEPAQIDTCSANGD